MTIRAPWLLACLDEALQRNPGCFGKVKFLTYEHAQRRVKRGWKNRKSHVVARVYRCKECRFWHIGRSATQ